MKTGIRDRVYVVTGASGGIGRAIARCLGKEGARLALQAHSNPEALDAFIREEGLALTAIPLRFDAASADDVQTGFAHAERTFGGIDGCIVNHGIWPAADCALADMEVQRIREVVEVNLLGAMFCARAFLRALGRSGPRPGGACITFVGSTAGRFGEPRHAEYAASKAALRGLVLSLKNEIVALDPAGRVNLVEPSWTATPMTEEALRDEDAVRRAYATRSLQQVATPDDIAHACTFLSSPLLARHVSGEILAVSGGMEGRLLRAPGDADPRAR